MVEKALQTATEFYIGANHQEKAKKIQHLLEEVAAKRDLSVPLSEIFSAPTVTSTTSTFSPLSLSEEKAVGLERFETADIQVLLTQHETDVKVGADISLEIQFANVGKQAVLLSKIEKIIPNGFQLLSKPDFCSFENGNLTVRGVRLEPLNTYEIKITLKSYIQGSAEIKPRVTYVDDVGRQMFVSPEPAIYNISGATLEGRVPTGYSDLDNLLFGGLPNGYAVLLSSPSIDERELLVKRFIETGVRNHETTFFVTVDPGNMTNLAEEYRSNFFLFVCSPRAEVIAKNLPNVFKIKGVEVLADLDIAFVKAFRMLGSTKIGPRRACLTVVSDILLQHHAVATRKWLSGLLPDLKANGFTTLVVINPQMHPPEEYQAISGLFEGEIRISERETANGLDKLLRVRKLYNQRYLENEISLTREKLEA
jgi:KaiC/GvpD/RAD55 family RecA-like ATPase